MAPGIHSLNGDFDRSGRYDARAVLRQTLLSGRNLYGIPLLHRTAVMKRYPFPEGSSYSCDVYLSAKTGEEGQLYHLPRILIENRYTGRNVTADVGVADPRSVRSPGRDLRGGGGGGGGGAFACLAQSVSSSVFGSP